MQAVLVVIFMIVRAIIGGVTNVIAIRMLFHPIKLIIYLICEFHLHLV